MKMRIIEARGKYFLNLLTKLLLAFFSPLFLSLFSAVQPNSLSFFGKLFSFTILARLFVFACAKNIIKGSADIQKGIQGEDENSYHFLNRS
jgi:hypothetical protein